MPNDKANKEFRGFRRPTTTPIPDEVIDDLLPDLSGSELKVLLYICRRTFGFRKDSDNISLNQMLRGITKRDGTRLDSGTGLSRPTLLRALKGLAKKKVIVAERRKSPEKGFQATNYRLNFMMKGDNPLGKKTYLGRSQKLTKPLVKKSNLQQTVVQDTVRQQQPRNPQNTTDPPVIALIEALTKRGITKSTARRLVQKYPAELIEQKIEVLDWLVDTKSPLVERNPPGYLRKGIEESWEVPKGFKSRAERVREHAVKVAQEKRWKQQQEQEKQEAERRRAEQEAERRERIIQKCGADLQLWQKVLGSLESVEELGLDYRMFKESILLPLEGGVARLVVPHDFYRQRLRRHEKIVQQVLSERSGTTIGTLQFLSDAEVLEGEP